MSESAHAERFFIRNGKLFKVCTWKSIYHYLKNCEEIDCKEPVAFIVGWNNPRFYGSKKAAEALCAKHAKDWYEHLFRTHTLGDVTISKVPDEIPQWIPRVKLTAKERREAKEYWDD